MISTTENFSFGKVATRGKIRAVDWNYAVERMERICAPIPTEEPFDWVVANLILDDPEVKGPFNPDGRQYLRDIINDNNDPDCREQTLITGTGVGKTLTNIAGIAWKIVHHPARGLMVMPATKGEGGAETFVNSRLIPALEATAATRDLMPDGQRRLFMNSKKVRINGSHFGFVGANSSSQIASNRCGDIRMDEADKFKGRLGNEAGTASLVKERIEGVADYQIFLNTTPTIETGLGWKNLLRSDFRRRFLPCPHCNSKISNLPTGNFKGWFTLAWSEQYCVLPTKFADGTVIPTAYIEWDKESQRKDGTYDLDRVFRSTRLVCPHCRGHVLDKHKIWMDARGVWIPTREGTPHHKGYHLSSLYAPPIFGNENSLLGGRALKFLNAVDDGEGMKGFINSTLAEVDTNQEHTGRVEMQFADDAARVTSQLWIPVLSVDNQQNWPYRWFVCRNFLAAVLRPVRKPEQQAQFDATLTAEQKALASKFIAAAVSVEKNLYSAENILRHLQRTDHWPRLVEWLVGQNIIGPHASAWFQAEFQTDLLRLIEFICRQKEVNIRLGRQGDSEALEIGFCDLWEEIDEIQARNKVASVNVLVDAAWNGGEVAAECFRRSPVNARGFCHYHPHLKKFFETADPKQWNFARAGWTPVFGFEKNKRWKDRRGIAMPFTEEVDDPFKGKAEANRCYQNVFKFDAQWALSEMARIRKRNQFALASGCRFTPQERDMRGGIMTKADYEKHLRGYYWDEKKNCWIAPAKKGGSQSRSNPNHLYDCEKNAIAWASYRGIFRYEKTDEGKK